MQRKAALQHFLPSFLPSFVSFLVVLIWRANDWTARARKEIDRERERERGREGRKRQFCPNFVS